MKEVWQQDGTLTIANSMAVNKSIPTIQTTRRKVFKLKDEDVFGLEVVGFSSEIFGDVELEWVQDVCFDVEFKVLVLVVVVGVRVFCDVFDVLLAFVSEFFKIGENFVDCMSFIELVLLVASGLL